jgi:hypothetical protein
MALLAAALVLGASVALAQTAAPPGGNAPPPTWRTATADSGPQAGALASSIPAAVGRAPLARVSAGNGTLPNDHGQVWREYDISPYTLRVTSTNRPEQAIIDWILRETGYETWHGETLGVLSVNHRSLVVYHTPQVQAIVADVVDRFVSSEAQAQTFALHVMTLDNPNWRARVQSLLKPVQVQTPGVQAWLLEREGGAQLLAELARRIDFRQHNSPQQVVNNGQSTGVSLTRGRSYVRGANPRPDAYQGYQPDTAVIDEGFSLEFSPLLSVDGKTIDATIKCNVDQVEKLVPVMIDVPTSLLPRQRVRTELPQVASFRFHERFRWPSDKVLLVSLGMVPMPAPADGKSLVPGLSLPLSTSPARTDMLVMVENKGAVATPTKR